MQAWPRSNDPGQPRQALRVKAQRECFALGKDFLERGIRNNPEQPKLYESLARLYRDNYNDHARASEFFRKSGGIARRAELRQAFFGLRALVL